MTGSIRFRTVALVAFVVSLLASPVTAVWAAVLGPVALVAGLWSSRRTAGRAGTTIVAAAAGVVAGSLPYLVGGLVIATLSGT